MDINEILSDNDIKEIYKDIYASPEYRKMVDKYQKFKISGNFAQMMVMSKKMKEYEIGVFEGIARRYIDKLGITNDWVSSMSVDDRKTLSTLSYGVYMMSDVLESFIMDINLLMKKNTDRKVYGFDKLNEAVKEAKKVVTHFDKSMVDEKATTMFGTLSSDLYKLIFNKASSYKNKLSDYAKKTDKDTPQHAEVA